MYFMRKTWGSNNQQIVKKKKNASNNFCNFEELEFMHMPLRFKDTRTA